MKRFIALLVFLLTTRLHAQSDFPIMIWDWVPNDPAVLKKIHECGITVAGFATVETLDAVHAAGMKTIVSDPRTNGYDWNKVDAAKARENVTSLVKETKDHPAVFGYYLRDEPNANWFPELAKVADVVNELAPGKWPYINLFPNYANGGQLGTASYEEYLTKFVETCKPPIMSYDHYALLDNGTLGEGYFQNLEQMRAAAIKAKVPFWNIVLSSAHFSFRETTAADLRFQAYTTLVYGGKGLSYFTYFAPKVGNYRASPIDQFGNETPTWRNMQNTNLQIHKLAPHILKLTSDDVYHFGDVPKGAHAPGEKSLVKNISGSFVVGDFTHEDGTRYVMCVNKDVNKSHPCMPEFREAPKAIQKVSPYTGDLIANDGEQVWVAPGQGVLLRLGK